MGSLQLLIPRGRALLVLDVVLLAWVLVWVILGLAIGREVRGLRQVSDTVTRVGRAIEDTGGAIKAVGSVPLVGGRVKDAASRVQDAGRSAVASGRASRQSGRNLSWMLALAIAVIPAVPVLGLYVPLRLAAVRERRSLRALLARPIPADELERALAHRALHTLPYRRLLAIADDPWADVVDGRYTALADAELARAGLSRPRPER